MLSSTVLLSMNLHVFSIVILVFFILLFAKRELLSLM
jgi:hypothetical protein